MKRRKFQETGKGKVIQGRDLRIEKMMKDGSHIASYGFSWWRFTSSIIKNYIEIAIVVAESLRLWYVKHLTFENGVQNTNVIVGRIKNWTKLGSGIIQLWAIKTERTGTDITIDSLSNTKSQSGNNVKVRGKKKAKE